MRNAALALLGGALAFSTAASAATYADGDLFLGFRASGGDGSAKDYLIDLGQAAQFNGVTAPKPLSTVTSIDADLSAASLFGPDWKTRGDVFWGIAGTTGSFSPVGTDPAKTLYATRARNPLRIVATPWDRASDSSQGITTSAINSLATAYRTGTANGSGAVTQNKSDANSWASFQPGGTEANAGPAPGISFGAFNPTIEGNFGQGTRGTLLDLYRLAPGSGPGDYLGFFAIDDAGAVTFYPPAYRTLSLESPTLNVLETAGSVTVNVYRTGDTTAGLTATVSTQDGTAQAGRDYTAQASVPVVFAPGETQQSLVIPVANLSGFQGDRTFAVNVATGASGTLVVQPLSTTVTIKETTPEPAGTLSFAAPTYQFAPATLQGGPNTLSITIERTSGAAGTVTADVSVTGGTLANGTDYTFTSPTTVSFAQGETSQTVEIPLSASAASNLPRTLTLSLGNLTGGAVIGANPSTTITVASAGTLSFSASTYRVIETASGDTTLNVTVNRNGGANGAASVQVTRTGGSATTGSDFVLPASATLSWADGDNAPKTFAITIKSDGIPEPSGETITLALASPTGAALGSTSTATVTILDIDVTAPVLTLTSPAANAKISTATVTISGTATDNQSVGRVEVRIDGGAPQVATASGTTPSLPFSFTATPGPGTHLVQVTAYDVLGNATSTISRSFTFVRADLKGVYTGLVAASPTLLAPAGFNGLVTLTVTDTGSFTGKLTLSGVTLPLKGVFGQGGAALFGPTQIPAFPVVKKATPDNVFLGYLSLTIDTAGGQKITGSIKEGTDDQADTLATVAHADLANPTAAAAKYTAVFQADAAPNQSVMVTGFPQGDGYATMAIIKGGIVTITGKLADGSALAFRGPLAKNNHLSFYYPLYTSKGYVSGDVVFDTTQTQTDASGNDLKWFKPAGLAKQKNYPAGWPNGITVDFAASKYAAPSGGNTALGAPAPANVTITLADGGIGSTTSVEATVDSHSKVTVSGTNTLTVKATLAPATGALSGSFLHPVTHKATTFAGVAYQKTKTASGYFLSAPAAPATGESGAVGLVVHP